MQATFRLLVDNNTANDDPVVLLDVYDATTGSVLARREVRRREFQGAFRYQDLDLPFDLAGRAGHLVEARVYWHGTSYVRFDRLVVQPAAAPPPPGPTGTPGSTGPGLLRKLQVRLSGREKVDCFNYSDADTDRVRDLLRFANRGLGTRDPAHQDVQGLMRRGDRCVITNHHLVWLDGTGKSGREGDGRRPD